jgi:ACS family hexuronate transporter-like MFS transporter
MGWNVSAAPATGAPAHPPIPGWKWQVVWLMFLATMINYMDRQTMGATAAFIMTEFQLTEEDYGWIEFSFSISYAVFQIFAGVLADRLNLRWLYAVALLVWSAAGLFTGLAQTVAGLMACRVILGVGEAFNWPCAVNVIRRIIPREARSLANGIFHSGASIGAAVTPLLVLAMVGSQGENWRWVFITVGAVGAVWAALWFASLRGERAQEIDRPPAPDDPAERPDQPVPPFGHVFWLRAFWISLAVSAAVNVCWHFFRVWLPRLLQRDQGFSPHELLYVLAGFFVAADLGSMAAGYVTRRLTHAGLSVERSRQVVLISTALLCLLSTPAVLIPSPWVAIPLIFVVAAGSMGGFPILFALIQEISPRHTAKCIGLIGALSWFLIAGLNPIIGRVVDHIGTFVPLVIAVGFVPLAGALIGLLWPGPSKPAGAAGRSPG